MPSISRPRRRRPRARSAIRLVVAVLSLLPWVPADGVEAAEGPVVLGWLEWARLGPEGMVVSGKLDTGADNSSLNARDLTAFRRDGRPWVRFTLADDRGRTAVIERPVERSARIKRGAAAFETRPVVLLEICVARVSRRVEVNLTDRAHLNHQLLIGRSFLVGAVLVDSAATYTADPDCPERAQEGVR